MRIILLGPPGSGKGTQGDLIEDKYGFPKISTGDLLRNAVKLGTDLGKKAEAAMNRGELVSDEIVIEMLKQRIFQQDCQSGYLLDGFPRNISQARHLDEIVQDTSEIVLDIHLSDQTLIDRISARRICPQCGAIYNLMGKAPLKADTCDQCSEKIIQREDDTTEVIQRRLLVYHEQTEPLIEHYRHQSIYYRIDGEGKIEDVFAVICSVLDKAINKNWQKYTPRVP